MTSRRQERIAELLLEELSLLIGAELEDPRLQDAMVTVTDVVVSPDLRNARVYVEHRLGPQASRLVLAALRHSESYLRRALGEHLNLRYIPELSFQVDETSARASRIDEILDALAAQEQSASTASDQGAEHAQQPNAEGSGLAGRDR